MAPENPAHAQAQCAYTETSGEAVRQGGRLAYPDFRIHSAVKRHEMGERDATPTSHVEVELSESRQTTSSDDGEEGEPGAE